MTASRHQKTSPRFYLALAAAKATKAALSLARKAGGQLPGVVAETIDPRFFGRVDRPEHKSLSLVPTARPPQTTC